MSLPLKIAWRYLVAKKGHQAVNIISIVAVCGVVVATAALICVLSVFNGFRGLIMGRLAMLDPQDYRGQLLVIDGDHCKFGDNPEHFKQVTDMIDAKLFGLFPME